jgi:hypothetical protein
MKPFFGRELPRLPYPSNDDEAIREERRALAWVSLVAVGIIVWLMKPVGMGIVLGALMAFTFQLMYERVVRRWPQWAAALATLLGSTLVIVLTFGGLVWLLIRDRTILGRQVVAALGPGGGAHRVFVAVSDVTSRIGISAEDLQERARRFVESAVAR